MAKIINLNESDQYNVQEVADKLQEYVQSKDIERVLVIFLDKDYPQAPSYLCGSKGRDYNMADVNWDIDHFKHDHLFGGFVDIED